MICSSAPHANISKGLFTLASSDAIRAAIFGCSRDCYAYRLCQLPAISLRCSGDIYSDLPEIIFRTCQIFVYFIVSCLWKIEIGGGSCLCGFDGSSFCSDFPKKLHQIASKYEHV